MVTAGISPNGDPMHESRVYAMVHTAVHDALNAIERHSQPYALDIGTKPGASPVAAVATAAHDVLVSALPELPSFATGVPAAVDAGRPRLRRRPAGGPGPHREATGVAIGTPPPPSSSPDARGRRRRRHVLRHDADRQPEARAVPVGAVLRLRGRPEVVRGHAVGDDEHATSSARRRPMT